MFELCQSFPIVCSLILNQICFLMSLFEMWQLFSPLFHSAVFSLQSLNETVLHLRRKVNAITHLLGQKTSVNQRASTKNHFAPFPHSTVVDRPLNSHSVTTVLALAKKSRALLLTKGSDTQSGFTDPLTSELMVIVLLCSVFFLSLSPDNFFFCL